MSDHQAPEHTSLIKTPKQLIIVVLLSFIVPVTVIIMLAQLAMDGKRKPEATAASEEAVAKRLKPAGSVVVDPNAPAPVAAAPVVAVAAPGAAAPAAAGGGDAAKGKSVYDAACMACHAAGVAGAPKTGDKAGWAPRLKTGKDALYTAAIKGKGAMPAKGGNASLSDGDVKAAVDYLIGLAK
ncbi:MAG: c-type cytochrome [Burkholderiales bacterium]|jgi:cytochrome c5|nr:c-type cytochrome [Burkholderiales bacterium]